jgi:hypothetical protein
VKLEVPPLAQGARAHTFYLQTTGTSVLANWAAKSSYAALAMSVAGGVLSAVGLGEFGVPLLYASAVAGAASSTIDIVEASKQADQNGAQITIDVLNIAGSLLSLGSVARAAKVMRLSEAGQQIPALCRTGQALEAISIRSNQTALYLVLGADVIPAIDAILRDDSCSEGAKLSRLYGVLRLLVAQQLIQVALHAGTKIAAARRERSQMGLRPLGRIEEADIKFSRMKLEAKRVARRTSVELSVSVTLAVPGYRKWGSIAFGGSFWTGDRIFWETRSRYMDPVFAPRYKVAVPFGSRTVSPFGSGYGLSVPFVSGFYQRGRGYGVNVGASGFASLGAGEIHTTQVREYDRGPFVGAGIGIPILGPLNVSLSVHVFSPLFAGINQPLKEPARLLGQVSKNARGRLENLFGKPVIEETPVDHVGLDAQVDGDDRAGTTQQTTQGTPTRDDDGGIAQARRIVGDGVKISDDMKAALLDAGRIADPEAGEEDPIARQKALLERAGWKAAIESAGGDWDASFRRMQEGGVLGPSSK